MSRIRVWAPAAKRVELVALGQRFELEKSGDGDFSVTDPRLVPGTEYAFSLDGGPPLPDPRSRSQPNGVHGASQIVASTFDWTDDGFRAPPFGSAVVYELHVGTFASDGTFDGVIERLGHLESLGVTHVEIMPVAEFPGSRGWGYDGVGLYAPHRAYGGAAGLKRLVDACHARGLAVLLDVVYNHLGPDGNYLPHFGPYLTDEYHTPWGSAVNLDGHHSEPVRRFLIDNALYWLREYHIDGLRLDAVHALYDRSARHFLRQLSDEVAALAEVMAKPLVLVAESDLNDPRFIHSADAGGFDLDAVWNDDFHHALHSVLTGERQGYYADYGALQQLARSLERGFVFDGQYSPFRKRRFGQPLGGLSLRRLVGFIQNHDQVGNRAKGERIGHLVSAKRARLGAAVLLLGPFVPLIFQGEEWNATAPFQYFTDHQDAALGRAVSEGRRGEFGSFGWSPEEVPDPQAESTFVASRLNFGELEQREHASMFEYYRSLIRLRRSRPELVPQPLSASVAEGSNALLIEREQSLIAVNFGAETARVELLPDWIASADVLLATEGAAREPSGLVLPPESLLVLVARQ